MYALTADKIPTSGRCPANSLNGVHQGAVYLTTMSRQRARWGWDKIQNAFYFAMFGTLQRYGTKNASAIIGGLLPICIMLAGCLVTEGVKLEDENLPPSFVDITGSPTPIGSLIEVTKTNAPQELKFELQVRDENVEQTLVYRYYLSTRNLTTNNPEPTIGPTDDKDVGLQGSLLRPLELRIDTTSLTAGRCYRLDLVVTSEFAHGRYNPPWDEPALDNDLARASWFISVSDSKTIDISIKACPSSPYKPTEYTSSDGSIK